MDPDAPFTVATNTTITSATTSFLSCIFATYKGHPIGPVALGTAVSSAAVSATFFSLREYVVSPILLNTVPSGQFLRRRNDLEAKRAGQAYSPEKLDWWSIRAQKLPDTAVSGAITGGVFNTWKRGRRGIVPGVTTGALVCTLLQLAYNELGITRLKYVSRKIQSTSPALPPAATVTSWYPAISTTTAKSEPLLWWERVFSWIGLRKVSDEEYLAKLKRERDMYLSRIAELEEEARQAKNDMTSDTR